MNDNFYVPQQAIISEIIVENSVVNTYRVVLTGVDSSLAMRTMLAGQFVMVSVPHCGEAPISICMRWSIKVRCLLPVE
ncbi:MAG: hypothetical protein B6I37_05825 [Desulfobacteraceae bacterium 4572_35.2]|nr:MAG: hypothetical protein B6I37_05825 [Desulfobacteraceae bacterium 4572_35.2]